MKRHRKRGGDGQFRRLYWYTQGLIRPHSDQNEAGLFFADLSQELEPLAQAVVHGEALSSQAWDALHQLAETVAGNEECRVQSIGTLGTCRLVLDPDDEEDPEAVSVVNGYRVKTNLGDHSVGCPPVPAKVPERLHPRLLSSTLAFMRKGLLWTGCSISSARGAAGGSEHR